MSILLQTLKTKRELAHIDVDELLDFYSNIPTEENLDGEDWEDQIFKNYVAYIAEEERFEPTPNEADKWIEELTGPRIPKLKHVIRQYIEDIEFYNNF